MSMTVSLLRVHSSALHDYLQDSSLLAKHLQQPKPPFALFDLDKLWDGLRFLLVSHDLDVRERTDLAHLVVSEQAIDPEQILGWAPAHYLTAEQVQEGYTALEYILPSQLARHYAPKEMDELEIYPQAWRAYQDQGLQWLQHYFVGFKKFYAQAVEHEQAIISIFQ